MKLEQLRKVIREEIKKAMKEELQEILNEAVKIASEPAGKKITYQQPTSKSKNSISEMLNQTKASMTSQEYRNVYTGTSDMVTKPNFASSMANSMRIAGAVYNKSVQKDKEKLGIA